MTKFACGFLVAYLLGAVPTGIIVARLDKPTLTVLSSAATWPHQLMRIADAVYIMQPAEVVVRPR